MNLLKTYAFLIGGLVILGIVSIGLVLILHSFGLYGPGVVIPCGIIVGVLLAPLFIWIIDKNF